MKFKMNKIVNRFLLTGEKFMQKLHLKQSGFSYSASVPFSKHCNRIQKFRETSNLKHYKFKAYRNELDKACFPHHTTQSISKDLANRTI